MSSKCREQHISCAHQHTTYQLCTPTQPPTQPPLSYPAAVILQQVHLDRLQAAIVTACVDLKPKTEHQDRSNNVKYSHSQISRLRFEISLVWCGEFACALTMFWWMAMHITMSLWPP